MRSLKVNYCWPPPKISPNKSPTLFDLFLSFFTLRRKWVKWIEFNLLKLSYGYIGYIFNFRATKPSCYVTFGSCHDTRSTLARSYISSTPAVNCLRGSWQLCWGKDAYVTRSEVCFFFFFGNWDCVHWFGHGNALFKWQRRRPRGMLNAPSVKRVKLGAASVCGHWAAGAKNLVFLCCLSTCSADSYVLCVWQLHKQISQLAAASANETMG